MTEGRFSNAVVPAGMRDEHLSKVEGRLAEQRADFEARAAEMDRRAPSQVRMRLLEHAVKGKTIAQRIHWLRREADVALAAAKGVSACRAGCSHCCHIGAVVAEPEAIAIARATGHRVAEPSPERVHRASTILTDGRGLEAAREATVRAGELHFGTPCPFLERDRCSIYEHRPLACRHLISLDVDELLCRLVPGAEIRAPYVDMRQQQALYLLLMGLDSRIADIRDWFPLKQRG